MLKLRIKALTFDVTNTLIKAHPSIGHQYADAARVHGITAESAALDRVFEATKALKKLEQPDCNLTMVNTMEFQAKIGGKTSFGECLLMLDTPLLVLILCQRFPTRCGSISRL